MIRRFWHWLKALFGPRYEPETDPQTTLKRPPNEGQPKRVKSANICLASRWATKRERRYAWNYLRRRGLK